MKRMLTAVLCFLCCSGAWAQEAYFIFIQNVSGQPFYVRLGEDSHSSSEEGHLILSSLHDSTYKLFIGFPRGIYPEQLFTVRPEGRDRGFELRRMDGEWRLFDLRTLDWVKPEVTERRDSLSVRSTDSYSMLMAGVVNDSAVLYKSPDEAAGRGDRAVALHGESGTPDKEGKIDAVGAAAADSGAIGIAGAVATVREPSPVAPTPIRQELTPPASADTGTSRVEPDTAKVRAGLVVTEPKQEQSVVSRPEPQPVAAKTVVYDKRDIVRYRTENVVDGKLMIYLDRSGPVTDTISIIIPRL